MADVVVVRRYAILSCMPETTTTTLSTPRSCYFCLPFPLFVCLALDPAVCTFLSSNSAVNSGYEASGSESLADTSGYETSGSESLAETSGYEASGSESLDETSGYDASGNASLLALDPAKQ